MSEEGFPLVEHATRFQLGRIEIFRDNCQGWALWDRLEAFRCPVSDRISFSTAQEAFEAWRAQNPRAPLTCSDDRRLFGRME